ncbi:MAG: DUF1801 domain-containing protein [Albidovulum sp.]
MDSFEDIERLEPQHADVLRRIRALVTTLHPDAFETARKGDRAVSWGFGPKKMSEAYVYAIPYKAHVNLGFYHGAELADPAKLLSGTGKRMRHLQVKTAPELDNPSISSLILMARDERRAALNL